VMIRLFNIVLVVVDVVVVKLLVLPQLILLIQFNLVQNEKRNVINVLRNSKLY